VKVSPRRPELTGRRIGIAGPAFRPSGRNSSQGALRISPASVTDPQSGVFAELLIDCEKEDRVLGPVLVWMLRERRPTTTKSSGPRVA